MTAITTKRPAASASLPHAGVAGPVVALLVAGLVAAAGCVGSRGPHPIPVGDVTVVLPERTEHTALIVIEDTLVYEHPRFVIEVRGGTVRRDGTVVTPILAGDEVRVRPDGTVIVVREGAEVGPAAPRPSTPDPAEWATARP